MLTAKTLRGVVVAIVTPFTKQEDVDLPGLERLTDHLIRRGVHAVMTTGGNGEFVHLSRQEKREVTERVVTVARGRVPVIAGTAACSTREAIELTLDAKGAGADGAILVPPYYFKLPEEALFRHFAAVAKAARLPIVVYNNPAYTGHNLSTALIARLARVPGIIGLKQSQADMGQLVEAVRVAGDRIAILTGIDSQFYPALCIGATGIFSTAACVIPRHMVAIYEAFRKGDHRAARRVHDEIQGINRYLEYDPGYVNSCKAALEMMGLPGGPVRGPMPPLTAAERTALRAALWDLKLLRR
jgi:4-hydroxy-tetrahydrodipicolinate synthase